jgi:hypothetical protein
MPKYRRRKESGYEVHMFTAGAALVLVGFLASVVAAWIVGY